MALAAERLMKTETFLDANRMVTLIDLVLQNLKMATVYLSLKREDYRKAWIAKRLKEQGFVDGVPADL